MSKTLAEIAHIFSGIDYKKNPPGDSVPIYGTGGIMGYTSVPLYKGPAVLSGRKGSINNPMYLEGEFWNVDTIFCIKANEGVDTKWLYYNFLNTDLSQLNEATGVPSVNSKALYKLKFKWFELPEQHKITHILSTCDAVIEKTQAAIAKYKAIKQGMLQDLFTRGINLTSGKLRPKYEDAPELYKESKLGMVPREWEVCELGKYIVDNLYGPRFSARDYSENGNVRTIRGTDFSKDGEILYSQAPKALLPSILVNTHKLEKGDVVIVTTADCGLTAIFNKPKNEVDFIPSAYSVKYRFAKNVNPYFIKYFMATDSAIKQVNKFVRQGTLGNLPGSDVLRFDMAYPKTEEQNEISKKLKTIDTKLQSEQNYLQKLQSIKQGLMGDLLSGRKRVKVTENKKTT